MKKRLLCLILMVVMLLPIQAFAVSADVIQKSDFTAAVNLQPYSANWFVYSGANSYKVSLRRLDDDWLMLDRVDNGNSTSISLGYLAEYSTYRVWVGAYNSSGTLIAQGQLTFEASYTPNSYKSVRVTLN